MVTGETLYRIALKYGVTVEQVQEANGIQNARSVEVGQTLKITTPVPTPSKVAEAPSPSAPRPSRPPPVRAQLERSTEQLE